MKKRKLIWNNHIDNGNYIINCSSDYTDEQLTIEVPNNADYENFHEIVDNEVYNYLVSVHNRIERETQGTNNISIIGSLVCNNLYKSYRSKLGALI